MSGVATLGVDPGGRHLTFYNELSVAFEERPVFPTEALVNPKSIS